LISDEISSSSAHKRPIASTVYLRRSDFELAVSNQAFDSTFS
jgi:hypothetical protein